MQALSDWSATESLTKLRSIRARWALSFALAAAACSSEAPRALGGDAGAPPSDAGVLPSDAGVLPSDVRWIFDGPKYMGSCDGGMACTTSMNTLGAEPLDASESHRYPLFLYFVGSGENTPTCSANAAASSSSSEDGAVGYSGNAAKRVVQEMARQGFVAYSIQYDNGVKLDIPSLQNKLSCLFDSSINAANVLDTLCSDRRLHIDCEQGITTWGHSQGAAIAINAATYDARVRGSWLTGYGENGANFSSARAWAITTPLPKDRLRIVNGSLDDGIFFKTCRDNNQPFMLNELTGKNCSNTATSCLDTSDTGGGSGTGSGWILVQQNNPLLPGENRAGHCWFDYQGDFAAAQTGFGGLLADCASANSLPHLSAPWQDAANAYSVQASAAWLAMINRRPVQGATALWIKFTSYGRSTYDCPGDPSSTAPSDARLEGAYPLGLIDWGSASNCYAQSHWGEPPNQLAASGGDSTVAHVGTSGSTTSQMGTFTFLGPNGRKLTSLVVFNSDTNPNSTPATLTVQVSGSASASPIALSRSIAPGKLLIWDMHAPNPELGYGRHVTLTSSNGSLLRITAMQVTL